jgi:hypothetical protein
MWFSPASDAELALGQCVTEAIANETNAVPKPLILLSQAFSLDVLAQV